MKRISRSGIKFGLMRMLSAFASARKLDMKSADDQADFLAHVAGELAAHKDNEALQYGLRTQAMFAYVAASLGECRVIKEEDAGEAFVLDDVRLPDFRILTENGSEFFVEVKNCHAEAKESSYRVSKIYMDGLKKYCAAFAKPLYFAIYWSRWKLWCLVQDSDFVLDGIEYKTTLVSAIEQNRMALLGDRMIGTAPSLKLVLYSDPAKPRAIEADGFAKFTIGRAALYCGEAEIVDKGEQRIAWLLMNYGDWLFAEGEPTISNGEVTSIVFEASPPMRSNPEEKFELAGTLSTMISRQFNERTAPKGAIAALDVDGEPKSLAVLIPRDYKGSALPLWRFIIEPRPIDRVQVTGTDPRSKDLVA